MCAFQVDYQGAVLHIFSKNDQMGQEVINALLNEHEIMEIYSLLTTKPKIPDKIQPFKVLKGGTPSDIDMRMRALHGNVPDKKNCKIIIFDDEFDIHPVEYKLIHALIYLGLSKSQILKNSCSAIFQNILRLKFENKSLYELPTKAGEELRFYSDIRKSIISILKENDIPVPIKAKTVKKGKEQTVILADEKDSDNNDDNSSEEVIIDATSTEIW